MSAILHHPGPPPGQPAAPEVPRDWKAEWDSQTHQWYYINSLTGRPQWEVPTMPAEGPLPTPRPDTPKDDPPPYDQSTPASTTAATETKVKRNFSGHAITSDDAAGVASSSSAPPPIPDSTKPGGAEKAPLPTPAAATVNNSTYDSDAKLAAELQAQEDARAHAFASPPPAFPDQLPPRAGPERRSARGRFSFLKMLRNYKTPTQSPAFASPPQPQPPHNAGGYPGAGYQQGYTPPPPGMYGGGPQPQPGYGGYWAPQPGYSGHASPQPPYGGGWAQPQQPYGAYGQPPWGAYQQQQQQQRQQYPYGPGGYAQQQHAGRGRPGMGMAGGMALGAGAGLLGAAALGSVIGHHGYGAYQEGYQDGADNFGLDGSMDGGFDM